MNAQASVFYLQLQQIEFIDGHHVHLHIGTGLGIPDLEPEVINFLDYSFVKREPWYEDEDDSGPVLGHIFKDPNTHIIIVTHTY